MKALTRTVGLALLSAWAIACDGRGNVLITGKLTEYSPRDSVFVTLTHNWESILMAPTRFDVQKTGRFELEFTVGRRAPPITFIKNRTVYAKLTVQGLWEHSPVLIDEISGKVFDLKYEENGQFTARIEL